MKKLLMTGLVFFISNLLKKTTGSYGSAAVDLTKLKVAMGYVQAIKVFRLLFLSLLGSGICLILFLTGLVLVHTTILLYAPWETSTKIGVTLVCGIGYILAAVGVFLYVFAEDQWLKIFNADKVIRELTDQPDPYAQSTKKYGQETDSP